MKNALIGILFLGLLGSSLSLADHKQKELTLKQRIEQLEQHSAEVDQYLMLVETRLWDLHDRLETIEQAKHTARTQQGWTSRAVDGSVHTQ